MNITPFDGFGYPDENWSKLPHTLIDSLPLVETLAELKIILYVLRHTWGFREYDDAKRITVDEFAKGRKDRTGKRLDNGTGLSEPSIRSGIANAIEHGFIKVDIDDTDKARVEKSYMLRHVDVIQGVNLLPPDERVLPPEGKELTPGGKKTYPRSEKETSERNSIKKPKKEKSAPSGAIPQKPSKKPDFSKPLKDWTWEYLEQYACDNSTIEILVALDGVPKLKNLPTAQVARDAVEIFKELQRNNIASDRWQSLYTAGARVNGTFSPFKKMIYALPNWLKSEPEIKVVTPDQTPGARPTRVMVGTEWVDVEELKRRKGIAS